MKILVTGAAGFIGFHVCRTFLRNGLRVVGADSVNDYYDPKLKLARLAELGIRPGAAERFGEQTGSPSHPDFSFIRLKLEDRAAVEKLFEGGRFDAVCHLAAQAGVRYSLTNPRAYLDANITGFLNVLEGCRAFPCSHLVFASSSSVYGSNARMPFRTIDSVDHPISLYAASKKSDELMAHVYSHLFGIPATGLRFFTVYGPWGRPDMALFLFTKAILEGKPIDVFNNGNMKRDFTYVEDIAEGVARVIGKPPAGDPAYDPAAPDPSRSSAPFRLYNIGRGAPTGLLEFIEAIEAATGKKAEKRFQPMQPGDVAETWADTSDFERDTGYRPGTDAREGVKRFVQWYRAYYGA